jgi:hypothetical protein
VLGIPTNQLVPVPVERLLRIGLEAEPAALGAFRWRVAEAD